MSANPSFVDVPQLIVTNFNPAAQTQTVFNSGPKGSRIYGITITSTDTITTTSNFYIGDIVTDNAMAFPDYTSWNSFSVMKGDWPNIQFTNTTNSTITRANGSFKADGWNIRDFVFTDRCNTNFANQVIQQITSSVAEQTLTFTGANFNAADTTPGPVRLIRVTEMVAVALVNGAGNTAGTPPIVVMSAGNMPSLPALPDTAFYLKPWQVIVCKMPTISAGKQVNVQVYAGQL